MKQLIIILFLLLISAGCRKEDDQNNNNNNQNNKGSLILKMSYHSTDAGLKSGVNAQSDTLYTRFGDYITSITPQVFIGKFLDMRLQNWKENDTTWNYGFNIIDNNTPLDSSNRLADFSNNASVSFNLNLNNTPDSTGYLYNIFVFMPIFYYQEFDLPASYDTVNLLQYLEFGNNNTLNNFNGHYIGGNRTGLTIKGSSDPFLAAVFDSSWTGFNSSFSPPPMNYVFGSTDSTYMYYSHVQHQQNINNPLGQQGYIIRSQSFNSISLQAVPDGQTRIVNGSMVFDTRNLIQIYAGKDNIPYTKDDVFVYSPRFWERLSVMMTAE